MLPNLRKIKDSKVVVIGSIAHNYTKYNFNDIKSDTNSHSYSIS